MSSRIAPNQSHRGEGNKTFLDPTNRKVYRPWQVNDPCSRCGAVWLDHRAADGACPPW